MKQYELTVILRNSKLEEVKKIFKDILAKYKANVLSEDEWGSRKLAYMIDGVSEGFYILTNLEADPSAIQKISAAFGLNKDILRYMFLIQNVKKA